MRSAFWSTLALVAVLQTQSFADDVSPASRSPLSTAADFTRVYNEVLADGLFAYYVRLEDTEYEFFTDQQRFQEALQSDPQSILLPNNLWHGTLYPDVRLRLKTYERMNRTEMFGGELDSEEKRRAFLKATPQGFKQLFADQKARAIPKTNLQSYKALGKHSGLIENQQAKWAACLRIDPANAKACVRSLELMLEFMAPSGSLAAIPLLAKVVGDARYTDGTTRAALKIMDRIAHYQNGGGRESLAGADLFQDLVSSFVEAGADQGWAEERTWDLLGLYSTRGGNIDQLFEFAHNPESSRTMIALQTIAIGLSVLDSATAGGGKLYSIPKNVSTVANYGKVYHFWMSAYLARMATLKHGNSEGASAAAALTEIGYQMLSKTAGRQQFLDQVISETTPGVATRKAQIDLAFGFAGAEFGARSVMAAQSSFDIDYSFKAMVDYQKAPLAQKTEQFVAGQVSKTGAKLLAWLDQTHPIAGFKALKSRSCAMLLRNADDDVPFALNPKGQ